MKNTRKLASLLLALVMLLAMAIPAFAAEGTGTITINNPATDQTYNIYQMFTLESYNKDTGVYSYKITDAWKGFVETGYGKDYFTFDTQGYVTLKDGVTVSDNSETAAAIAQAALTYAKTNNISSAATLPKEGKYTASLPLGYYLVDSSLGALCGLTTTKPEAKVNEKNITPTVKKEVKEDSTGKWGETNDADFGQTVEFKTTITVQPGAQNYVLHDNMSAGLDFVEGSIKVTVNDTDVATDNYTIVKKINDNCDFEIEFQDSYVAGLDAGAEIIVSYSATLNTGAVVAGEGNPNETWLDYGDGNSTHDATITYTYRFDLVKTNKDNAVLTGAKFKLYDAQKDGNEIQLVKEADGTYRMAITAEEKANAVDIEAGNVTIKGLDSATYYLEETQQPTGYNKLSERKAVVINGANLEAEVTTGAEGAADTYVKGGIQVVNLTGSELPSTGGIGTTIFYIVGGVLLVVAGVLLVVRRRMSIVKEAK